MLLSVVLMHTIAASAQWNALFVDRNRQSVLPVAIIDSIKPTVNRQMDVYVDKRTINVGVDTLKFNTNVSDTVVVDYQEDGVHIYNPRLDLFQVDVDRDQVFIKAMGKQPFVCRATGSSSDGRIVIDADTTMTFVLDNLSLASQLANPIYLKQKQNVTIELVENSVNILADASEYKLSDTTDVSKGCLYGRGSLTFKGKGMLTVKGNYRYGVFSGKNIAFENGHLIIDNPVKDGIRCDKFTMKKGVVALHMQSDASKGIKAKEKLNINGGRIEGEATGGVVIEKGDVSYCTLLKSDGTFSMKGGELALVNTGKGGRCISVDEDMSVTGGTLNLECHGDGAQYVNVENEQDYYTPKCITVDDSLSIESGALYCTSTGLGGKGIVAKKYIGIGSEDNVGTISEEPLIRIETKGECIINSVDEDQRFGCPKGIKSEEKICIYNGDIAVTTAGMGGEGVESKNEMFIYGGNLECNTFDDGINVDHSLEILGGQVYCNSVDNDGIDSNGSITISGGIVASINQKKPNESFDSEKGQLFFYGGVVFGIGSMPVAVKNSSFPFYSTPYDRFGEGPWDRGLIITQGKYAYIQKGDEVVMALRNDNKDFRSFITIMHPSLTEDDTYFIGEGDSPININYEYFDKKFIIGGTAVNSYILTDIQMQSFK